MPGFGALLQLVTGTERIGTPTFPGRSLSAVGYWTLFPKRSKNTPQKTLLLLRNPRGASNEKTPPIRMFHVPSGRLGLAVLWPGDLSEVPRGLEAPDIMSASKSQIHYIECLAIDLEMDRRTRQAHISAELEREVRDLDTLSGGEASRIIDYFKRMKGEDPE